MKAPFGLSLFEHYFLIWGESCERRRWRVAYIPLSAAFSFALSAVDLDMLLHL